MEGLLQKAPAVVAMQEQQQQKQRQQQPSQSRVFAYGFSPQFTSTKAFSCIEGLLHACAAC
jgi:hypothetical protein